MSQTTPPHPDTPESGTAATHACCAPAHRRRFLGGAALALGAALAAWLLLNGTSAQPAPSSTALLLDGKSIHTDDLRGKVALVNFWATSCASCVAEMPMLAATHEKYATQGYTTLAIAMQYDPPAYVLNFARSRQLPFPVALDADGSAARAWGHVRITPTSYVLNRQGEIVKTYVGPPDEAQLHQLIETLLAQPA